MIAELMAALSAATSLTADTSTSTRDASTYWILAAGPVGGAGTYLLIYRYYRNQDKSHHFERDTLISAKPVEGTEKVVDRIDRTTDSEIDDGNSADHRERVQRLP